MSPGRALTCCRRIVRMTYERCSYNRAFNCNIFSDFINKLYDYLYTLQSSCLRVCDCFHIVYRMMYA